MSNNTITDDFKDFFSYLNESLPDSTNYMDLSNLCITMFFTVDFLPEEFKSLELKKEALSIVFSKICEKRNIATYPYDAYIYGASFHNTHDKGHWLEVLASTLKLNTKPDIEEAKKLLLKTKE
ncbi:hypothetical protein [uncultured Tenacibaculum sp.]|uniref:hypothetical protein n=1 Tax=uncultured Tenacibaculum sp. TaxID=174713 RepID=UPI0026268DE1|nr:hypothetical protein [uncultured Tenacibaculum sp.]